MKDEASKPMDERGACLCTGCNCWVRPSDGCSVCNRAASTSANVAQGKQTALNDAQLTESALKDVNHIADTGFIVTAKNGKELFLTYAAVNAMHAAQSAKEK